MIIYGLIVLLTLGAIAIVIYTEKEEYKIHED